MKCKTNLRIHTEGVKVLQPLTPALAGSDSDVPLLAADAPAPAVGGYLLECSLSYMSV